ncbi:hypothetical protein [Gracilibacillus salinarum]|uniref:Flagellar protein FliS n=1 Tax=Gracilibacillus salinarum TaxID=2932255 RepID=A0ABY4GRB8_9BACI|nr:hypothetical protein [Gracilibacillus salinarum]UOQ86207.1 hypothetical protein MUN87_04730 [Gracilibacillus salinarum]
MNRELKTIYGSRRVVTMNTNSTEAQSEIMSMEYFDALLVDARHTLLQLMESVESGSAVNKAQAKRDLENALKRYETLLRTITPYASEGWLRYYYANIRDKASAEVSILRKMVDVVATDGVRLTEYVRRYISALIGDKY